MFAPPRRPVADLLDLRDKREARVAKMARHYPATRRREDQRRRLKDVAAAATTLRQQPRCRAIQSTPLDCQSASRSTLPPKLHPEPALRRDEARTPGPEHDSAVGPQAERSERQLGIAVAMPHRSWSRLRVGLLTTHGNDAVRLRHWAGSRRLIRCRLTLHSCPRRGDKQKCDQGRC